MAQHRVRLTDEEVSEIVAALRARAAMRSGTRGQLAAQLVERLEEMEPGNPDWRFSRSAATS